MPDELFDLEAAIAETGRLFTEAYKAPDGRSHPIGQDMLEQVLKNQLTIMRALATLVERFR